MPQLNISDVAQKLLTIGKASVRFAPSPTGRFHVGNLRTALIARQMAWDLGKKLWVRFEDIDRARVSAEFLAWQLDDLKQIGILNEPPDVQSARLKFYELVFRSGVQAGLFYPCFCSRKEVEQSLKVLASAPHEDVAIYSGCCRDPGARRTSQSSSNVNKEFIGWRLRNPADSHGQQDFLVARTRFLPLVDAAGKIEDFQPSYHFACGVDDWFSQCDVIVRAWDLEGAVLQQRQLMQALAGLFGAFAPSALPAIFHTSLVTDNTGHRLEKRTQGVTLLELLEKYQLAELKNLLLQSFSSAATKDFVPSKIWGEAKKTLTLAEIGLK